MAWYDSLGDMAGSVGNFVGNNWEPIVAGGLGYYNYQNKKDAQDTYRQQLEDYYLSQQQMASANQSSSSGSGGGGGGGVSRAALQAAMNAQNEWNQKGIDVMTPYMKAGESALPAATEAYKSGMGAIMDLYKRYSTPQMTSLIMSNGTPATSLDLLPSAKKGKK